MSKNSVETYSIGSDGRTTCINLGEHESISLEMQKDANKKVILTSSELKSISNIEIILNENSKLDLLMGLFGMSNDINLEIHLNGFNSDVHLKILSIADNCKHCADINVTHNSKNSKSNILATVIANNDSHVTINSIVSIKNGKKGSISFQKIVGNILDAKSIIIANPVLLIDEYDVQAGHGASIGSINEEVLFYLMSRGISRIEAKGILLQSVVNPFINLVDDENLKQEISDRIQVISNA